MQATSFSKKSWPVGHHHRTEPTLSLGGRQGYYLRINASNKVFTAGYMHHSHYYSNPGTEPFRFTQLSVARS
jgi:hypothetical protein